MARQPGDDLFSDSVMSFGDHIEELRTSLARALVGLVIGVAFGFLLADNVVRLIERPLRNALKDYHALRAVDKYGGEIEPEQLTLIERGGIAPENVQIELSQLIDQVNETQPGLIPIEAVSLARLDATQMELVNVKMTAQKIAAGKDKPTSDVGILWQALSAKQKQQVEQLAKKESFTADDRKTLRTALNAIIDDESIAMNDAFQDVSSYFRGQALSDSLRTFQVLVNEQHTPTLLRRLNRWIVCGVLSPHVPRPRPHIISVPMWTTVDAQIITLNAQEAFMVWFKAAMLTGFLIASPWIFYQIWMFVAAGLYPHEKGYVYMFLPFSLGLFAAGAALAFFGVFPFVLKFLFSYNRQLDIMPNLRLSEWMSLALFLPIGFGISFQLPLVMLLLERIGIFTIESYVSKWRIAVLVISVISMVLTPADPGSMIMMAVPLVVLYFGGVGLCRWLPRRESPFGEGIDPL